VYLSPTAPVVPSLSAITEPSASWWL